MSMKLREVASGFTRTFWVANVLELFERFAFYGSKAVLTIYLPKRVGLGPQAAGSLAGLFSGVLYTWQAVVAAMFVLALGEAMQAPRFYEYVADLAPRDQVGTFMGFAFLPVAIGSVVGGVLAGSLVQRFVRGSTEPSAMWWVISVIGFAATAAMV